MWSLHDFLGAVSEIVRAGLPLTQHQARQFLDDYPLSYIFEVCQRGNTTVLHIRNICGALNRVLSTTYGSEILPQVAPYAAAALGSKHVEIRKLGIQQILKLLSEQPAGTVGDFLEPLLLALQDTDTEVGAGALSAVECMVTLPSHFETLLTKHGSMLAQLAGSDEDVVRLRVFQLLLSAASRSESAHQRIEAAGLLDPLLKELDNYPDPLACLSAWHLFGEAVQKWSNAGEHGSAVISGVCRVLGPRILGMLGESDDEALLSGMLSVTGPVLGAGLEVQGTERDAAAEWCTPFMEYLNRVLKGDTGFQQEEMLSVVLDTVGQIGVTCSGAEVIIRSSTGILKGVMAWAFSSSAPEEVSASALHSVATLAGSEWSTNPTAALSNEAEAKLESVVFSCCADNGGTSPGECLWDMLQNPVPQHRVAVYRCMAFLGLRPWCAASICSYTPLLNHLIEGIEPKREVAEWRFACLQKIAVTARNGSRSEAPSAHCAILLSSLPTLESAVSKGPFARAHTMMEATPIVATDMR